ncbi:MAG: hypothetical protein Q9170_006707, partial [Blastenia crenularia]
STPWQLVLALVLALGLELGVVEVVGAEVMVGGCELGEEVEVGEVVVGRDVDVEEVDEGDGEMEEDEEEVVERVLLLLLLLLLDREFEDEGENTVDNTPDEVELDVPRLLLVDPEVRLRLRQSPPVQPGDVVPEVDNDSDDPDRLGELVMLLDWVPVVDEDIVLVTVPDPVKLKLNDRQRAPTQPTGVLDVADEVGSPEELEEIVDELIDVLLEPVELELPPKLNDRQRGPTQPVDVLDVADEAESPERLEELDVTVVTDPPGRVTGPTDTLIQASPVHEEGPDEVVVRLLLEIVHVEVDPELLAPRLRLRHRAPEQDPVDEEVSVANVVGTDVKLVSPEELGWLNEGESVSVEPDGGVVIGLLCAGLEPSTEVTDILMHARPVHPDVMVDDPPGSRVGAAPVCVANGEPDELGVATTEAMLNKEDEVGSDTVQPPRFKHALTHRSSVHVVDGGTDGVIVTDPGAPVIVGLCTAGTETLDDNAVLAEVALGRDTVQPVPEFKQRLTHKSSVVLATQAVTGGGASEETPVKRLDVPVDVGEVGASVGDESNEVGELTVLDKITVQPVPRLRQTSTQSRSVHVVVWTITDDEALVESPRAPLVTVDEGCPRHAEPIQILDAVELKLGNSEPRPLVLIEVPEIKLELSDGSGDRVGEKFGDMVGVTNDDIKVKVGWQEEPTQERIDPVGLNDGSIDPGLVIDEEMRVGRLDDIPVNDDGLIVDKQVDPTQSEGGGFTILVSTLVDRSVVAKEDIVEDGIVGKVGVIETEPQRDPMHDKEVVGTDRREVGGPVLLGTVTKVGVIEIELQRDPMQDRDVEGTDMAELLIPEMLEIVGRVSVRKLELQRDPIQEMEVVGIVTKELVIPMMLVIVGRFSVMKLELQRVPEQDTEVVGIVTSELLIPVVLGIGGRVGVVDPKLQRDPTHDSEGDAMDIIELLIPVVVGIGSKVAVIELELQSGPTQDKEDGTVRRLLVAVLLGIVGKVSVMKLELQSGPTQGRELEGTDRTELAVSVLLGTELGDTVIGTFVGISEVEQTEPEQDVVVIMELVKELMVLVKHPGPTQIGRQRAPMQVVVSV